MGRLVQNCCWTFGYSCRELFQPGTIKLLLLLSPPLWLKLAREWTVLQLRRWRLNQVKKLQEALTSVVGTVDHGSHGKTQGDAELGSRRSTTSWKAPTKKTVKITQEKGCNSFSQGRLRNTKTATESRYLSRQKTVRHRRSATAHILHFKVGRFPRTLNWPIF